MHIEIVYKHVYSLVSFSLNENSVGLSSKASLIEFPA